VKQPVLILSAKDSVDDKVLGLEIGADDYLAKPFHLSELLARVKSIIRRNNQNGDKFIRYKNVWLNPDDREVQIAGEVVPFNRKEYDILYYFMLRPNKLFEKTIIAETVWGDHADQADNLDFIYSQIKNLRKKMKEAGAEVDIQAVYGIGYKLI
jgi:DNA-binding response OmpR family regulator